MPTIWLHAGEVIETLLEHRDKDQDLSQKLTLLTDFARAFGTPGAAADFSCALTILQADERTGVRGELHVAPNIERLPPIQRTGVSTPTMDGLQLGFDTDRIDDPNHQRSGSLFFTKAARNQALCSLLTTFLQCWPASALPDYPLRARLALGQDECKDWETLLQLLLRRKTFAARSETLGRILGSPGARVHAIPDALRKEFQKRRVDQGLPKAPSQQNLEEMTSQQKNALSALYLHWRRDLDSKRHLGKNRLGRVKSDRISNIVVQGAGDLSMNAWNVAYYHVEGKPQVLIPPNEPFGSRRYYCLLGFKTGVSKQLRAYCGEKNCMAGDLAIIPLRFSPGAIALAEPGKVFDPATEVDFAVYGKVVIRDGRIVNLVEVVDEFLDLRHVFDLPNLNSSDLKKLETAFEELKDQLDVTSRDRLWQSMKDKPRPLFGQMQTGDVWLLERALLEERNLRHLACLSSIAVPLDLLGAPRDWVTVCLQAGGYEGTQRPESVQQGQFAWDLKDIARPVLNVHLKPSRYPCSMVGLGSVKNGVNGTPDCIYLLAWGHDFKYARHSIHDCARVLHAAGARWALALDEGQDVFQFFAPDQEALSDFEQRECEGGDLTPFFRVPIAFDPTSPKDQPTLRRTSLRASLAFWQETPGMPR